MTIEKVLKECGWNDELIAHFVKDEFFSVLDDVSYPEDNCIVDNSTIVINSNLKKDATVFIL